MATIMGFWNPLPALPLRHNTSAGGGWREANADPRSTTHDSRTAEIRNPKSGGGATISLMANEFQTTAEGLAKMRAELEELKGPARQRVAEAIREAKSHGDLRENAAYHEAKLNQQRLDARITELEKAVQMAKVVERPENQKGAHLGSKIGLLDAEFEDEFTVTLVGAFEADAAENRISITSPLGEALLGKEAGARVEIMAPAGKQTYTIVSVD
jgi:transcription elongation factor GreA